MWICKQFHVLPSSQDFQNLTSEQRSLIWEDYLLDNPKIKEQVDNARINDKDEDFDELWDLEDLNDIDLTEGVNMERAYENIAELEKDRDNIEYTDRAKEVFKMIEQHEKEQKRIRMLNGADWEEDDDDIEIDFSLFDDDEFSEV